MKQILCFGDSNTWGYDGESRTRLPWKERWTGILQEKLGSDIRVIEEGLCGRTTIFEDPLRQGRKGSDLLPVLLETHNPIDLVMIMLGTNDCKTVFQASAEMIGNGISCLVDQVRKYTPDAQILLISPIHLGEKVWQDGFDREFCKESVGVSRELENVYRKIACERGTHFLNASDYVKCCEGDQEHMYKEGHQVFAGEVYDFVKKLYP